MFSKSTGTTVSSISDMCSFCPRHESRKIVMLIIDCDIQGDYRLIFHRYLSLTRWRGKFCKKQKPQITTNSFILVGLTVLDEVKKDAFYFLLFNHTLHCLNNLVCDHILVNNWPFQLRHENECKDFDTQIYRKNINQRNRIFSTTEVV